MLLRPLLFPLLALLQWLSAALRLSGAADSGTVLSGADDSTAGSKYAPGWQPLQCTAAGSQSMALRLGDRRRPQLQLRDPAEQVYRFHFETEDELYLLRSLRGSVDIQFNRLQAVSGTARDSLRMVITHMELQVPRSAVREWYRRVGHVKRNYYVNLR